MNPWIVVPALLSTVLVLLLLGQYNSRAAERDWADLRASAEAIAQVAALEQQFERDGSALRGLHEAADARRAVSPAEAARYLDVACGFVEGAAPDRIARLWAMGRLARMAAAVGVTEPVDPWRFRLGRTRSFAAVAAVVHHLLVSTAERLAWRCTVLGMCVRIAVGCLVRSNRSVQADPRRTRAWRTFAEGLSDWQVLDREHLVTLRALVRSLAVEYMT